MVIVTMPTFYPCPPDGGVGDVHDVLSVSQMCRGSEIARVAVSESAGPCLCCPGHTGQLTAYSPSQQLQPDTSQGCEGGKERPGACAGERQEAARGVSVDIVTHALTRPRPPVSYFLIRKLASGSLLSLRVSEEMRRPGEVSPCVAAPQVPHCHNNPWSPGSGLKINPMMNVSRSCLGFIQ